MAKWTLFIGDEAVSCEDGKYFGPEDIVAALYAEEEKDHDPRNPHGVPSSSYGIIEAPQCNGTTPQGFYLLLSHVARALRGGGECVVPELADDFPDVFEHWGSPEDYPPDVEF